MCFSNLSPTQKVFNLVMDRSTVDLRENFFLKYTYRRQITRSLGVHRLHLIKYCQIALQMIAA